MSDLFILADDIKYRRENFGGIVFDGKSKETHFFNHAAAFAIENFKKPNSIADVQALMSGHLTEEYSDNNFFRSLLDLSIIKNSSNESTTKSRLYFTNITEFKESYLFSPLAVELELTLKCMRSCVYCAYDSSPRVDTDNELSLRDYQAILKQLLNAGVFYIRFTGGDPLTRKDSLNIMSEAEKLGFGFAVASDLTVLNNLQAKQLGNFKNLISLQTTLDGSTPDIADKLRGPGNYRKTLKGIALLRQHGVPIIVGTILTKHNVNDIYNISKILSEFDIAYCVSPLYDAGRARTQRDLIPSDDDLAHAYEQFARAVSEGFVRPADPGWSVLAEPLNKDKRDALWNSQPWLVRSPDRIMRVDPKGRCYTSIHLKEIINDDIYIGNLPEDDLISIWNNSILLNTLRLNCEKNNYFGNVLDIRNIKSILEVDHGY